MTINEDEDFVTRNEGIRHELKILNLNEEIKKYRKHWEEH